MCNCNVIFLEQSIQNVSTLFKFRQAREICYIQLFYRIFYGRGSLSIREKEFRIQQQDSNDFEKNNRVLKSHFFTLLENDKNAAVFEFLLLIYCFLNLNPGNASKNISYFFWVFLPYILQCFFSQFSASIIVDQCLLYI